MKESEYLKKFTPETQTEALELFHRPATEVELHYFPTKKAKRKSCFLVLQNDADFVLGLFPTTRDAALFASKRRWIITYPQ